MGNEVNTGASGVHERRLEDAGIHYKGLFRTIVSVDEIVIESEHDEVARSTKWQCQ